MNRRKKRQPADSATAVVAAMVNASLPPLAVPKHVKLRSGDRPFWDGVLRARARDEWSERGVLKRQVPLWLKLPEFRVYVVGFEPAHVGHGGEGALYVRIKKPGDRRRRTDS